MCDYCDEEYKENDFKGSDGIIYDQKKNKYYLIIEHFRGERNRIEVNYCTKCGRELFPK